MNKLQAVRTLLTKHRQSAVALAKHCNVSRDNIYKTLSSKVTKADNPTMIKIADFFDMTVGELIDLSMKES